MSADFRHQSGLLAFNPGRRKAPTAYGHCHDPLVDRRILSPRHDLMTYQEAQKEFRLRIYRWAKFVQGTEAQGGFSRFRFCKEWPSRKRQFIQELAPVPRAVLCQALLQARHQAAFAVLGEPVPENAKELMLREENFRMRRSPGT